ncbi:MAG: hypothetical protein SP1CHLAM54_17360 [Chlamydiia bacterium]|nr:hypothetical protein [Chlamydiia bacterium]MCH9616624.1 hypothetical protein [Chlamydiia bacterium]MCH9629354.1 hypothetical protein [Chlamydiia bacterium]
MFVTTDTKSYSICDYVNIPSWGTVVEKATTVGLNALPGMVIGLSGSVVVALHDARDPKNALAFNIMGPQDILNNTIPVIAIGVIGAVVTAVGIPLVQHLFEQL